MISTDEKAQVADPFIGYNDWARENLNISCLYDFVYETTDGTDRGVFVSEDVIPQSELVSVPFTSLLTTDSLVSTPLEFLNTTLVNGEELREDDKLSLLLIYHKYVLGEESLWSRHIAVIPTEFNNVFHFSSNQLLALKGSNVHNLSLQVHKQVTEDFEVLENVVLPELRRTLCVDKSVFSIEQYRWALSVIWSRFVSVHRKGNVYKSMAPVFDMFNHDPYAQMSHCFNEETDSFCLIAHQRYSAGSQVCINYGKLSNHKLLTLYGFVIPNNPYDNIEIWAPMSPEAPNFEVKNQLLLENGIQHSSEPFQIVANELCPNLIVCLRIQRLSEADLSLINRSLDFDVLDTNNEREALGSLQYALELMMDEFDTTIEEDEKMLELWDVTKENENEEVPIASEGEKMAIVLRLSDKRILQANIDILQNRLDELEQVGGGSIE